MIKTKATTKITGDALFKEFTKVFKTAEHSFVDVGILEPGRKYPAEAGKKNPPTLGQVAAWMEFGTHNKQGEVMAPSRSFIRAPLALGIKGIERLKKRVVNEIAQGRMTFHDAFDKIGFDLRRRMQNAILKRIPPPLAPYTVAQRKSDQGDIPLYRTKWLWRNIHYEVKLSGKAKGK